MSLKALIFDVDGTLAETETIHLAAFNAAFAHEGLDWRWSFELYRDLLGVTGGKERIQHYAERLGIDIAQNRVATIHAHKNKIYSEKVQQGECAFRPGVERLMQGAEEMGIKLAICTTTSRANIVALLTALMGSRGPDRFASILCGEDVRAKKPAPEAYLKSLETLGVHAQDALAFEDSRNGLRAALAAGLRTIVTPSVFTAVETFEGAAQISSDLDAFDLSLFMSN